MFLMRYSTMFCQNNDNINSLKQKLATCTSFSTFTFHKAFKIKCTTHKCKLVASPLHIYIHIHISHVFFIYSFRQNIFHIFYFRLALTKYKWRTHFMRVTSILIWHLIIKKSEKLLMNNCMNAKKISKEWRKKDRRKTHRNKCATVQLEYQKLGVMGKKHIGSESFNSMTKYYGSIWGGHSKNNTDQN